MRAASPVHGTVTTSTQGRGLERRLHANDGQVGVLQAQGGRGCRRGGVAGNHNCLATARQKALQNLSGAGEHPVARLLAVGSVGGVTKEEEVLVRKQADALLEHADAAQARVEHADVAREVFAHLLFPLG